MHAGAIRTLLYGLCVYMGDNPFAEARGLFPRTNARPYNNLHLYNLCLSYDVARLGVK